MKRDYFLRPAFFSILALFAFLYLTSIPAAGSGEEDLFESPTKPNVLIILIDDLDRLFVADLARGNRDGVAHAVGGNSFDDFRTQLLALRSSLAAGPLPAGAIDALAELRLLRRGQFAEIRHFLRVKRKSRKAVFVDALRAIPLEGALPTTDETQRRLQDEVSHLRAQKQGEPSYRIRREDEERSSLERSKRELQEDIEPAAAGAAVATRLARINRYRRKRPPPSIKRSSIPGPPQA